MKSVLLGSAAAVVVLAGLAAGPAGAQQVENQFLGHWHWNKAKSTLAPGEPAPKDASAVIESADGGTIRWTAVVIDQEGQTRTERFNGKPDGTPYPVQGTDSVTAAFTWTNGTLQSTFKGGKSGSDTQSCRVEADAKTMTCRGTWTDGAGSTQNYVDVYDRV